MVRPLASNRPSTSPTRPRRTVSGLSRTRVRCDMSLSLEWLVAPSLPRLLELPPSPRRSGGRARSPPPRSRRRRRRARTSPVRRSRARPRRPGPASPGVADLVPQQPGRDAAPARPGRGRPAAQYRVDVGDRDHHRRDQRQHERLERRARSSASDLTRFRPSAACGPSRVRASPAVITEPVIRTPPRAHRHRVLLGQPDRVVDRVVAAAAATMTRSSPKILGRQLAQLLGRHRPLDESSGCRRPSP